MRDGPIGALPAGGARRSGAALTTGRALAGESSGCDRAPPLGHLADSAPARTAGIFFVNEMSALVHSTILKAEVLFLRQDGRPPSHRDAKQRTVEGWLERDPVFRAAWRRAGHVGAYQKLLHAVFGYGRSLRPWQLRAKEARERLVISAWIDRDNQKVMRRVRALMPSLIQNEAGEEMPLPEDGEGWERFVVVLRAIYNGFSEISDERVTRTPADNHLTRCPRCLVTVLSAAGNSSDRIEQEEAQAAAVTHWGLENPFLLDEATSTSVARPASAGDNMARRGMAWQGDSCRPRRPREIRLQRPLAGARKRL